MDLPLRANDTRRVILDVVRPVEMKVIKAHIMDIASFSREDWHT